MKVRHRVARLVERVPEAGQSGRAERRVLHHPPVAQALQHLGAGARAFGRPAPDHRRADVVVLGGEQGQPRPRGGLLKPRPACAMAGCRAER